MKTFKTTTAIITIALLVTACASQDKSANSKNTESQTNAKTTTTAADKKMTAKNSTTSEDTICRSGKVTRTIRVDKKDGRCAVLYTKDGSEQEIATGAAGSAHCSNIADRVKNNLSAAGYKCE